LKRDKLKRRFQGQEYILYFIPETEKKYEIYLLHQAERVSVIIVTISLEDSLSFPRTPNPSSCTPSSCPHAPTRLSYGAAGSLTRMTLHSNRHSVSTVRPYVISSVGIPSYFSPTHLIATSKRIRLSSRAWGVARRDGSRCTPTTLLSPCATRRLG
jgi:hypothetical protein